MNTQKKKGLEEEEKYQPTTLRTQMIKAVKVVKLLIKEIKVVSVILIILVDQKMASNTKKGRREKEGIIAIGAQRIV